MTLKNKNVLIISPEPWDHIFVSKHHYAIHLARRGNKVYFLNPPSDILKIESTDTENLWVLSYKGFARGLRFFPRPIQRYFARIVLKKLETLARSDFNVVWSFDNSVFFDFRIFPKKTLTISHIVDVNQDFMTEVAAHTASICLCNTDLLLNRLSRYNGNVYKINHGYNEVKELPEIALPGDNEVKALYVGNLNISFIDWRILHQIVEENRRVDFIFIGPGLETFVRGDDAQTIFKKRLALLPNVFPVGKVSSETVPAYLKKGDVMLICYQEQYHNGQAASTHKFMEYLGSGKVIVSSFTKEFEPHVDIVAMPIKNRLLPGVFRQVVKNLYYHNSDELRDKRKRLAAENSYEKQIERIERLIYDTREGKQ